MSPSDEPRELLQVTEDVWERHMTLNYKPPKTMSQLEAENAKLREALGATLARLSAANEAAGGGFMDERYCDMLRELGIEVGG